MAKTRIKTTPTRMQKEALIASAAVVTTTTNVNISTEHVLKKRLTAFNHSMLNKEAIPPSSSTPQSTIIVQPPKRTNSISSITSTISHTSDGCSSVESSSLSSSPLRQPMAAAATSTNRSPASTPTNSNGPTMAELTENAIKTLNAGLLAKSNSMAMKNRKVYMITEKCDDANVGSNTNAIGNGNNNGGSLGSSQTGNGGQKRKMYLIMEEKESDLTEKFMKSECSNGGGGVGKKLTLFTDTANGQLPQKIEKILPEILNCIQAKGGNTGATTPTAAVTQISTQVNNNGSDCSMTASSVNQNLPSRSLLKANEKSKIDTNERLPLTLPPKKNRTKIITTQIIPVNSAMQPITGQAGNITTAALPSLNKNGGGAGEVCQVKEKNMTTVYCSNGKGPRNGSGLMDQHGKLEKSSATPVIVNANTLLTLNGGNNNNNGTIKMNGGGPTLTAATCAPQMHKNINLSADFLFLMKMLPKLESIAETHKNYVKSCIEDIINQYSTIDSGEEQ